MSLASGRSGFPEYLPRQRQVELAVLDSLRATFELHGFCSLETRAVEPLANLLAKGETDKEIYLLHRLQAVSDGGAGPQGLDPSNTLGLHFDLTVPLARYVVENAGRLDFPFRRFQIQRCWRGERPQEGRFREFTQADLDIVGRDTLSFDADVEVAAVMAEALSALPVPQLRLQINNRKLLEGFFRGLGAKSDDQVMATMRAVDKLDKLSPAEVHPLLVTAGFSAEQAQHCLALAAISATDDSFVESVRRLEVHHPMLDEGLDELVAVVRGARAVASDRVLVTADLRIARGLDYYTGTVFETRMEGFEHLGSICSGGRYDALATDGRASYPGTGISLGVTRLLAPLLARGLLDASRSVPSVVLVALADDASRTRARVIAQTLRARGIATEVAPEPTKYGQQIKFADRRGIPYVWFPQEDGSSEVRELATGEQTAADPAAWAPPAGLLRPSVIVHPISPGPGSTA